MRGRSVFVLVLGLLLGLLSASWFGWRSPFRSSRTESPAVVLQIKRLQELVTVRYSVQRIVHLTEDKVPLGSESILLQVQGEVLAGVDLNGFSDRDVVLPSSPHEPVTVALPPAAISAVYLDETQTKVWDRHVTWWTPWVPYSSDLESRARQQGVDDVRAAALQMGIVQQAQNNAERAIRDLLGALQIDVRFARRSS